MKVRIHAGVAQGTVPAPFSKSFAHRALIGASLADGVSTVHGIEPSEDILATLDCARALGARIALDGDAATVYGGAGEPDSRFPCRESGSTLRFFLPLCLLRSTSCILTGSARLMERPQDIYESLCREQGLKFAHRVGEIEVCGPISSGNFHLRGDLSSQFFTG